MQHMPHQIMGYDRSITMFSPDGRLLQVEYAKKTVKQGSTAIGVACSDGVLLVADRRIVNKLALPESIQKIFKIDDHLATAWAGISSDARVLVERSQVKAQQHRIQYDSPVDVISIVKDIANLKQMTTQSGGLRPFGVSMLFAGVDSTGPKLYQTDPTGIFLAYKAAVIGECDVDIEEYLKNEYKDGMTIDEALKMVLQGMHTTFEKRFSVERIDAAYISADTAELVRVSSAKIEKVLKEIKKK
jgi:proteasome alpha subunit